MKKINERQDFYFVKEDQTEVIPHSNPEVIRDLYFPELKLLGIINPVSGRSFCIPLSSQ